jgi:hypothetical protein
VSVTERRRYPRFPLGAPAALFVAGARAPLLAALANLCEGGCFVATRVVIWRGSELSIAFQAEGQTCAATGIAVRHEAGRGVGIEFSDANPAILEFVRRLGAAPPDGMGTLVDCVSAVEIRVV